jgi:glycolate oxidase subunit GlcD
MKFDKFLDDLRQVVGKRHVSANQVDKEIYAYDASLARGVPDAVVFPGDTSEISRIVQLANEHEVTIVPRGFGTNLSGGTVLENAGLVICLSRFNKISSLHPDRRYAVVQPGVTNLELQNALAPLGFFYAPDPASQKVSTLGGNVGENSGGPRCLKYGVTTNHILGMEFVDYSGEVVKLGGPALDPPGYDLRGVVVGSEGTFGIVTEVTVRILPLAEKVITMLAIYEDISDAARSVSAIISAGMVPTTLEMMDSLIIKAVEDSYACGYPRDAAAVLIIEVEGPPAGLNEQADAIRDICLATGCRGINKAKNDEERNRLWEGRRGAFGAVARLAPNYLVNDCSVPRTKLPEALNKVKEIAKKHGFSFGNVFHAGDGNLHPLLFFDARDQDQLMKVKQAGWEIMEACVNLGGTISGEHGIGIEKMGAMRMIFSEVDLEVQRTLKKAFDPNNLLNPGKVIPNPPENKADIKSVAKVTLESDIIDQIRESFSKDQVILPIGKSGHLGYGNLCTQSALKVDSSKLNNLDLSDLQNQVIVAGSGISLDQLQLELIQRNHWLPIRPPFSHRGYTLGGLIALGACGPERISYGAPRDALLGLRYINHEGQLISTGGKVMKNVSGYDMTRLITGSAGTLGFITEATLRVALLPERCVTLVSSGSFENCSSMAIEFVQSSLQPIFNVILPEDQKESGGSAEGWKLFLGFEGLAEPVNYRIKNAIKRFEQGGLQAPQKIDYSPTEGVFVDSFISMDKSRFILRADFPLHQLFGFLDKLSAILTAADVLIDVGSGRILAAFNEISDPDWEKICQLAVDFEGHTLLEKAPDAFKRKHDVFGVIRPEWRLNHLIKEALDPKHRFSPGCLPGKI